MNCLYTIPPGVQPIQSPLHMLISTAQTGMIAIDATLLAFWQCADSCLLSEIDREFHAVESSPLMIRVGLACLTEAGLLARSRVTQADKILSPTKGALVSVIIVSHNSRQWLETCLDSIASQSYTPLEIIVVDNASSDDSADWILLHAPQVQLIQTKHRQSLAHAINEGINVATGKYLLVLNPDTRLESDAIAQLVQVVESDPTCAAVAAKLKFMWAPAFLNGIGNHVGAFAWSVDNGLGYLDLGQFDTWDEISSACFAAALISRSAWEEVGKLDEKFPLYYEDSEWCYRARLRGYTIRAAPKAIVYHAFSSRVPNGTERGMSPIKLENVVYGRLRFATKLLSPLFLLRFLLAYTLEDLFGFFFALLRLDAQVLRAYWNSWYDLFIDLPVLLSERKIVQRQRRRTDRELFGWQRQVPPPSIWHGLPVLTWDLVQHYYLPLILSGKTRALPEFADISLGKPNIRLSWWSRARLIWRNEGWRSLFHRIAKYIQWRLAQV